MTPDVLLATVDDLLRGILLVCGLVIVVSLAVLWFGVRDQRRGDQDAELWDAIDRWSRQ